MSFNTNEYNNAPINNVECLTVKYLSSAYVMTGINYRALDT